MPNKVDTLSYFVLDEVGKKKKKNKKKLTKLQTTMPTKASQGRLAVHERGEVPSPFQAMKRRLTEN